MQGVDVEKILSETTPFYGVPYVGCAVTIPIGSDRYPASVSWVSEKTVRIKLDDGSTLDIPRSIRVKECDYRGVHDHSNEFTEDQRYVYFESDHSENWSPDYQGVTYTWRPKFGRYVQLGVRATSSGAWSIFFGARRAYFDPSF
jgi:hypothetical protein